MSADNIYNLIPSQLKSEVFEEIIKAKHVRIERILSQGHASPPEEWYDQKEHEWVIVLQGGARIVFADGREVDLEEGQYLNIPARVKHKVAWTAPDKVTVWLAVFYV